MFFFLIFFVSVILIGYRYFRVIELYIKIYLIKEVFFFCIIGYCMRKGKIDNLNWKKFKDYRIKWNINKNVEVI